MFAAAAALEPRDRPAYLDDACQHDQALRRAVENLLAAHEQAGSFGDHPAFAMTDPGRRFVPGSQIGAFRIEALLGAGGMGEVYRAHDTRLGRAVAIKVLPESFAHDRDRRERFELEARALAALNHPNIAAIYGVEDQGEVSALVLELVEGPTLADRLASGPLSPADIESLARQIAEALEAAHDRGIVHRDLKPANLKVTPDGVAKILDFGLAKAVDASGLAADSAAARNQTGLGMVVGTAAYMSPEQARGQLIDKRTDIWAFGCVLFEMCAGRPPFAGHTPTDTLLAVIDREPDWNLLDANTPSSVVRLLRRCLTKDPKLRLRDIGEARIALSSGRGDESPPAPTRQSKRTLIATAAIVALLASLATAAVYRRAHPPTGSSVTPVRFAVPPPDGGFFVRSPARTFFALSPDGSQLAFVGNTDTSRDNGRVWLRTIADFTARPMPGSENAGSLFWSPDGRSIAFFADGKLKRIDLPGGAVSIICDVPADLLAHGTWGRGNIILFATSQGTAIYTVPSSGGSPRELLTPNREAGDVRVHWPWFLPDGQRFLYTARRTDGEGELRLGQLGGGSRALMPASSNAQWVDPNVVVFVREGVLMGQRVDVDEARTIGEPFSVADHVDYLFTTSRGNFSAAQTGSIAYHEYADLGQLVWVDQRGTEVGEAGEPADFELESAHLSTDGTALLTARRRPDLGTFDIWRQDLIRQTEERLTTERGAEVTPMFLDNEHAIVYAADRGGSIPNIYRKDLVTDVEQLLHPSRLQQLMVDVIPSERSIIYMERTAQGTFDYFRLPLTAGASPVPLLQSFRDKGHARVSPDARAFAFTARDGPNVDLYVTPLPVISAPILVARATGRPLWSRDSRRLYFVGGAQMQQLLAVDVQTGSSLTVGTPQPLFSFKRPSILFGMSRDGRFLVLVRLARASRQPISVAVGAIAVTRQ